MTLVSTQSCDNLNTICSGGFDKNKHQLGLECCPLRPALSSDLSIEFISARWVFEPSNRHSLLSLGILSWRFLLRVCKRKTHWIGCILRRNCLLRDFIEGQMTEVN